MTATTTAVRCATCELYPEYVRFYPPSRHLTIRPATAEERAPGGVGAFWATGKPMRAKKYVVVDANTRAEAVFWAERWASKNDGHFIRPEGWENVVGALR